MDASELENDSHLKDVWGYSSTLFRNLTTDEQAELTEVRSVLGALWKV
jgi:hypothetical protein